MKLKFKAIHLAFCRFMCYNLRGDFSMTNIYIVRHCEAEGNVKRMFQGLTDLDITELGVKQLKALEERFSAIHIDRVIASPLIRTRKTAKAIIGEKSIPLEIDEGLIELNGGIIEGKTFDEIHINFPDFQDMWQNHPEDFAPENGETMVEAYDRIWNTVFKIAKENRGKTVACASHGGVLRCLNCKLLKDDITKLKEIPFGYNTAITLIEFDDNLNYRVVFYDDASHITEELMNKAAAIPTK